MNQAVKVLVVFVAVASLSFMALTGAVTLGGPNWWGRAQDLTDYTFGVSSGDTTTYSVTHRSTGEAVSVPNSAVHAAAVVAALKNQKQRQTAREAELDELISLEEKRIEILNDLQKKDVALLEARTKEFQDQLTELNQTIVTRNKEIDEIIQQTFALDETLGERREDVLRLRDQLVLVRTDRDRLIEERGELEDILVLLEASIDQLERRTAQLQQQN